MSVAPHPRSAPRSRAVGAGRFTGASSAACLAAAICIMLCALLDAAPAPAGSRIDPAAITDPDSTFVVKSPRPLTSSSVLEVLAVRRDVHLVRAGAAEIEKLRRTGCFAVPLSRLAPGPPAPPPRRWNRVDDPDPDIQAMVDEVEWDDLAARIGWLQDFQTRWSFSPQCLAAAEELLDYFTQLGLSTRFHAFNHEGTDMFNVEATQTGAVYPDSVYIICAHYDSISDQPATSAPGADDNASGSSAVMTAAEILSQHSFEYTIKYVLFAGEEQGLIGSGWYALDAMNAGEPICGAMNFDMIGWWEEGADFDLEIETNHDSFWMAEAITNAADLYTGMIYELHVDDGAWWGDHYPFWQRGYCAVNHEEAWDWFDPDFNPFYHSAGDLLQELDPDFTVGNARVAVAGLATLARPCASVSVVGTPTPVAPGYVLSAGPNPFRSVVRFSLDAPVGNAEVRIGIYDVHGRLVRVLPMTLRDGRGDAPWRVEGARLGGPAAGVYFCRPLDVAGARPIRIAHVR